MTTGPLSPFRSSTVLAAACSSASSVTSLSFAKARPTGSSERAPAPATLLRKLRRVVFMVWPGSHLRFSGRQGSSGAGAGSLLLDYSIPGQDKVREQTDKRDCAADLVVERRES